jgi:hypothetical protein
VIVYYDPATGFITGLSYKLIESRHESYIETDDPIAELIFLGKEKISKYKAVLRNKETKKGVLIFKDSNGKKINPINNRVHRITGNNKSAEICLLHNKEEKTFLLTIEPSSLSWWKEDSYYNKKTIYLVAAFNNDPSIPLWTKVISVNDLVDCKISFKYSGTDNFSLFTDKFFETYSYEIKSS